MVHRQQVLRGHRPESSWERFLAALESDMRDVIQAAPPRASTRSDGRDAGSGPSSVLGTEPRRKPPLRPAAARAARRPVVADAVPRHAADRRRKLHGGSASPASWRSRRRPQAANASNLHPRWRSGCSWRDLRRRRRARRLAARASLARHDAGADGDALERHPLDGRERFTPGVYRRSWPASRA